MQRIVDPCVPGRLYYGNVYFRIQGPTLIIEFSTEDGIAADGPHFHSIYRDPTNEYGAGAAF